MFLADFRQTLDRLNDASGALADADEHRGGFVLFNSLKFALF